MAATSASKSGPSSLRGAMILFDLDGTLVDTAPDLVRALNQCLTEAGFPPSTLGDVRAMVGRGSRALILRALARCGTGLPEPRVSELQASFLAHYGDNIAVDSALFPGALDVLDTLKAKGAYCAVATNKPGGLARSLLRALNIDTAFTAIVGADDAPHKKPDPAHLIAAAGAHGLDRAVMIGDSGTDVAAAHRAGVPVVVLRHGYSETPVDRLHADVVLDGFSGLLDAVDALLSAQSHQTEESANSA